MDETARIRVLVVDDNQLARLGLRALIASDRALELVGEAKDGAAALPLFRQLHPDVVLVDLRMPKLDGVQLTAELSKEQPRARVLVVTQYEGDESIVRALQAGALGYVTKESEGDEMLAAIRKVAAGERYVPASIAARLADRVSQPALSLRELQVLGKVFDGLSNKEIAAALAISERTVGVFVSNVLAKLGAKSRTEALRIALERGILSPPTGSKP